ncbi:hypothetical protein [Streptosporangium longisporum]|uniref:Uncharacterized protein n=1 Tax=Streptosporangium longisporum TaxID=46187 RepID=A0ABP6KZN8_9ACTN
MTYLDRRMRLELDRPTVGELGRMNGRPCMSLHLGWHESLLFTSSQDARDLMAKLSVIASALEAEEDADRRRAEAAASVAPPAGPEPTSAEVPPAGESPVAVLEPPITHPVPIGPAVPPPVGPAVPGPLVPGPAGPVVPPSAEPAATAVLPAYQIPA